MLLLYKDKRRQWVIEVTYASQAVRVYGPIRHKEEAEAFLDSRLVDSSYPGPRGVDILSARVTRIRRWPDAPAENLVGIRLVLP